MKKLSHLCFLFILLPVLAFSQKSDVPSVITESGRFERIVVVRMKNDTDLLEGLKDAVEKEKIGNAVILSGAGSLTAYSLHVVDNTTFPTENACFMENIPVDIASVSGYVFDGRVHAHMTVSDENKAIGGHVELGNKVFTFAIITLGVFAGNVDLDRFDDKNWK